MIEGRKMRGTEQNNFFSDLIQILREDKKIDEGSLNSLSSDQFPFQINYYKITANEIIDDVEAKLFNIQQDFETTPSSKLVEMIKASLQEQIAKKEKGDKSHKSYSMNNNEVLMTNIIKKSSAPRNTSEEEEILKINNLNIVNTALNTTNVLFKTERDAKKIKFDTIYTFDEDSNGFSDKRNDNEIKLNFFEDKNTQEYPLVPNNESFFMEKFKEYFFMVKDSLKENYFGLIGKDSKSAEIDRMILLVLFENIDGKPSFSDLGFFDPLNNFKKYTIRDEDLNTLNDFYFFNGQIVMIEGDVDNTNTITLRDIRNGFVPDSYNLDPQYIKSFFKNVNLFQIELLIKNIFVFKKLNFRAHHIVFMQ